MYVIKDNVIKLSVRGLVEFICRSGDIDNRTGGFSDVRLMQEGTRMHKKIQKSMGASYRAEVPLKIELPETVENIDYIIRLEGRADGIISDFHEEADGSKTPVGKVIIDEIKTMQSDVEKLEQPVSVHEAQAKVYGYIYMVQNHLSGIGYTINANFNGGDYKNCTSNGPDEVRAIFDAHGIPKGVKMNIDTMLML